MKTLHKELQHVPTKNISFDKDNPRGLTATQITNDVEFPKLVASIAQHGILEPLIVKAEEKNKSTYILIDGERRLRAAVEAKLQNVPALIAKDDADGRILAYQVHMLRQQWNKAAETKAIKKIISDLTAKNPKITDAEIKSNLIKITAHKDHEISDIIKLCKYDDKTIEKVITNELNMSYLVQIESSFINPAKKHHPDICTEFGEEKIRSILVNKALDGKLGNTRFLMDYFKPVFEDVPHKKEIKKSLTDFLTIPEQDISATLTKYEALTGSTHKPGKRSGKAASGRKKKAIVTTPLFTYKAIRISRKQHASIEDIRSEFERIATKFTAEEKEYLQEALFCLEKHCFKAATLMVWAAGISRVLTHIGKHLADFNTASQAMFTTKKSVWKHVSNGFQKAAASVDDIRVNSNDIQLLCYLTYKKYITEPEFKKLRANHDTRNDCAHPTSIRLSTNEIIIIFENIRGLILNNKHLA